MPTEGPASVRTNSLSLVPAATLRARELSIGLALLLSLAIYFALHVVTRVLLSNNLQLDEAELFVVTQDWRLGYGSQPPLYDWIQKGLFELVGVNVLALSLLKNVTLWSTYAFTFLAAREILNSARLAALAAVSLLFFPQIAWESQRDQSHLVLATALAAATLFVFVRVLKTGETRWYLAFGAATTCGFLAKYNYVLLVAALLCASLMVPRFRRAILSSKMLWVAAVFVILAGPHLVWMIQHKAAVASQSYKFSTTGALASLPYLAGPLELAKAFVGIVAVPLLMFSPLLWQAWKTRRPLESDFVKLLAMAFAVGVGLSLFAIVCFQVTFVRDRWLQPLLFAVPIVLIGVARLQFEEHHFRRFFQLAAAVSMVVLIAINGTALGANVLHRAHNLNIPYPALAAQIRSAGFERGTIVAKNFMLGGNLKNQFRDSQVVVPEMENESARSGKMLIVWSARGKDVAEDLLGNAAKATGIDRNAMKPQFVEVPSSNGPRKTERLGFVLLGKADADVRVSR